MIVTFYSYKGGTGRTMAMANIAGLLASRGKKVLAVDFDLEAPGLWRYFSRFHKGLQQQEGLIDLLLAASAAEDPGSVDWRQYVTEVPLQRTHLSLMTSGKAGDDYPSRVLNLDWTTFFRDFKGGEFIEYMRTRWRQNYDFTLIDSRTGITDTGGICTILLPDMIVPVFVSNWQSLEGVVDVIMRAQAGRNELAYDRPPAAILPILSRFDSRTEWESAQEWLDIAAAHLKPFYADWLPRGLDVRTALERTKLPYVAYFSFGETLPALAPGISDPDSLGYALNTISRLIESELVNAESIIGGTTPLVDFPSGESLSPGLEVLPIRGQPDARLYVWTAADSQAGLKVVEDPGDVDPIEPRQPVDVTALRRGQLPNLQRDFAHLGRVFDRWLAAGPARSRGMEPLRVLWLVAEGGPERSKALLACLSRTGEQRRAVYDAGRDLDLAASTLGQSIIAADLALPPLISVDLKEDQPASPWGRVETAVTSAGKQLSGQYGQHLREDDPYPRMIVAGTVEQEAEAAGLLYELVDITSVDLRGRDHQRYYTLGSQPLSGEYVYNRGLPITALKLFGRRREIAALRQAWESEQLRVLSVVATGGTGKSALVNAWLREMQGDRYRGAEKVLAWSFYSQGTKENLVSADLFVSSALSWLGDDSAFSLNPWTRGLRLASLIKQHNFLLVLDGLEPLQYPLKAPHLGGQLTDDSIRALLEELAKPDWEGLCLITTRVPLTDLSRFQDEQAGSGRGSVKQMNLENLNERDAADLLQHLIRSEADFRDLQVAVREVEGHALAITLLGNYLRDVHGGDLSGRFDLERLTADVREGGHARRVMASYEGWLERHRGFAELAILRLIGLFDRPAAPEAMEALLADTRMTALIGELEQVGDTAWNSAVGALREMGLLNREFPDSPGTLDAHPLVREHFRDQLRGNHRDWWLQGNHTLFDYYQGQAPPQPVNSTDMNTLYAAVTHGCAAELYQEVFDEVLLKRVWRDRRTNYSTRRLGMTGSDLVALSNYFYPRQWTELRTPSLSARARVLVLTNAGVRLRQVGRLVDARDCFGAVVREIDPQAAQAEDLEDASYAATQYCELLVISGKLTGDTDEPEGALFNGKQALEYADRGNEPYFSMHARSSLAEVYFMLNDLPQADSLFEQAMAIERDRYPRPPFLYSQSLFRYGYFLIETDRAENILSAASQNLSWGTNGDDSSLLSEAIRLLILGAAHRALIERGNREPVFLAAGETILDDAISAFQTAGYADYTVRGLLERAHFYRARHDTQYYTRILADLGRAATEAMRGQMDLLYADVLLQQVACYLDFWPAMTTPERSSVRGKINDGLAEATRIVTAIGYRRRQAMLTQLQTAAREIAVV